MHSRWRSASRERWRYSNHEGRGHDAQARIGDGGGHDDRRGHDHDRVGRAGLGDDGKRDVHWVGTSRVTEANVGQAFVADFGRCHFSATGALESPCVAPVASSPGFDVTLTGDVSGTSSSGDNGILGVANDLNPATIDFPFVTYQRYVVSVARCGTGSFVIRIDGNLSTDSSTWQIVPNSGRGDLTGISGRGTGTNTIDANGSVAQAMGRIRCGKHHDD